MRRGGPDFLRWISIALILSAVALFFYELIQYSRLRARLPAGLVLAGVPVGGLDRSQALERLLQVYSAPIELHYGDQIILLSPADVGFELDTEAMIAAAELARSRAEFWGGFYDYLWNRTGEGETIPLRATYSRSALEAALTDIALRYDEPPSPPQLVTGSTLFSAGESGQSLDKARATDLLGEILTTSSKRRLNLPLVNSQPVRPSLETLEVLLKQNIDLAGFNGLVVLYLNDLSTGKGIHFAYFRNQDLPAQPDIAFTGASVNKIGIMTAFYEYFDEPLDAEADRWLREMVTESGNDPADWLMERLGQEAPQPGPLVVTQTLMEELSLESTFIVGYYRPGSLRLRDYLTPGNQRPDINTVPDPYNQTTASEIGMLLTDIYQCGAGGGSLLVSLQGKVTSGECQKMLDLLAENNFPWLIEGGVPEGTRVAHKHGYTESPLEEVGDAAIIYTPGGNFVLTIFLWNDTEMIWEPTSRFVSDLAATVYNYYSPPQAQPVEAPK
jgi:hypothetical protein